MARPGLGRGSLLAEQATGQLCPAAARFVERGERLSLLLHARGARRQAQGGHGRRPAPGIRRALPGSDAGRAARRLRGGGAHPHYGSGCPTTERSPSTTWSGGRVATETAQISDFVIQRSDGFPTYMLAVTVDDLEMDITHVIRGEDLLASTPRQMLIREALGVTELPVFAHLPASGLVGRPPLVQAVGGRLGPRLPGRGFPSRSGGRLPRPARMVVRRSHERLLDRRAGGEVLTRPRVGRNPAAFDVVKLEWLNGIYIKQLAPADLAERLVPFCVRTGIEADSADGRKILTEVAPLISERLKRLDEAPSMIRFLFGPVTLDEKALKVVQGQAEYLGAVADTLSALPEWSAAAIESALRELAAQRGLKPKQAFQPIRAAVTGTLVSPPLFESLAILAKDTAVGRLRAAPQTVVVP